MTQAIGVPQSLPAILPVEAVRDTTTANTPPARELHARADAAPGQAEPGPGPAASQDAALRQLSESLRNTPVDLQYRVDQDTNLVVVKLVSRDNGDVIRQIPSEEMLRIAKAIDTLQGVLLHQTA